MSVDDTGKTIRCDGPGTDGGGCRETIRTVVSLRPSRSERREADGWLFVATGDASQHFCPNCAQDYLSQLSSCADPISPRVNQGV